MSWDSRNLIQTPQLRLKSSRSVSFRGKMQVASIFIVPKKPRILGASKDFIERGGFQFQGVTVAKENPWELLEAELEPGVIPAIGDYNSAQWILHLGLGDELSVQNELDETLKLRLVGFLQRSIFQSELLISEANFKKLLPKPKRVCVFLNSDPSISRCYRRRRNRRAHWTHAGKYIERLRLRCQING